MPKIINIHNENNHFQHIEVIKLNRYKRHKNKEFFVEGVKAIDLALQENWDIVAFIYEENRLLSSWAINIIENSRADNHYVLPNNLMAKLSDKENSSELLAIIKIPEDDLSRIKIKDELLLVVFDRPSNPGNLGTIIRSCESFKVDGLIITGHSADLYDSKTIRASVGSIFTLPVVRLESHKELKIWIDSIRFNLPNLQIVGTSAHAKNVIYNHDFKVPTIMLIGNETSGLSENYETMCDTLVSIPIYGSASSLNVANAVSISLYEIDRQRSIE